MSNPYLELNGRVIEGGKYFAHVFALNLNPLSNNKDGLLRCILSREGSIHYGGYIDRSQLYIIKRINDIKYKISEKLVIKYETEIIKDLCKNGYDFLGLEDPDIWYDDDSKLLHLYFTIPLIKKNRKSLIHLGHAQGKSLTTLVMTKPVLIAHKTSKYGGAKELVIVPKNKNGYRLNLVEGGIKEKDHNYSAVRVAIAKDMSKNWKFGKTAFHPGKHKLNWIAGHASPGPLLPKDFINVGENKLLGFMNGRQKNTKLKNKIKYGNFTIGLYIYDYEKGFIDWVSSKYLIKDSEAKTITFASEFMQLNKNNGYLYAHVDDSFVRAYKINSEELRKLIYKL